MLANGETCNGAGLRRAPTGLVPENVATIGLLEEVLKGISSLCMSHLLPKELAAAELGEVFLRHLNIGMLYGLQIGEPKNTREVRAARMARNVSCDRSASFA